MAVLGYLAKLKRGVGLVFGAYFLHDFSQKCSLFNTLSIDKVSMAYFFTFSRYQIKVVNKFLFKQDLSSFKECEEEVGEFENENGNHKTFFPSNIPTFFLDPVDALSLLHNFFQ